MFPKLRLVLIASLFSTPAFAERRVTLEEAYRMASAQNLDLAIVRQNHEQAEALVQQAWGLMKPSVRGTGTYTFRDQATTVEFGIPGGPSEEITIMPRTSLGANLVVSQPLFNARTLLLLSNAQDNREAASLDAETVRHQIVLGTAQAFWAVATARRVLEVNRQLKGVAEANLRAASARFEAGSGLRIDVTRSEIDVQVAERQIANATAALADAKEGLGLVLGLQEPVDVVEPESAASPATEAAEESIEQRPDVRSATLREGIANREVDAAWWALAPTLDASWILSWTDDAGQFGRETQWQIVATLSVPFYDGGIRYGIIRQRESQHAQARAASDRARRQARAEIHSAERAVEAQRVAVATAERQVELARQAMEQAQAAYEAGASTNLEVIQAQQGLRDAEVAVAVGRAQWQVALVRLLVSLGQAPGV